MAMRKGWLVYTRNDAKRNQAYIDWMQDEAGRLDIDLQLHHMEGLSFGIHDLVPSVYKEKKRMEKPEFAIVRTINPIFSKHLESAGIHVFNSSFVSEICNNKSKTHQYLAPLNIPMLDTIFVYDASHFEAENMNIPYPVVVKEVAGRGGVHVHRADSLSELQRLLTSLKDKQILIQQMAEVPGKDVRVFVIGKQVIGAVMRSSSTDFRANYSLGGEVFPYTLSEKQQRLVETIIHQFDFGFVGIDFLFDRNGNFVFNEIEDIVGSRTLSLTTDINVVKLYLEHILSQLDSK